MSASIGDDPRMSQGPEGGSSPPPGAEPAQPIPAWGPGRAFAGLGLFLLLVIAEAAVISAFDPELESLAATLVLQALLAGTMVAVAFIVASPGARTFTVPEALGLRRPGRGAVVSSVIAYFVYIGCAIVVAVLLQPEQEDITRELGVDEGTLGKIAAGALIIVAAPISEEIFFRGFIFAGLRRSVPFVVAAVLSAAIWGIFHYTGAGSWGVVVQLTVFGIVLAWLYERTGSIWPTIVVHAFNNAVAFTILTTS